MLSRRRTDRFRRHRAFTLLELMICVAIIGILATYAIPNYFRMQMAARMGEMKSNIAAVRTAEESYNAMFSSYIAAAVAPGGAVSANKRAWNAVSPGFDELGWAPEGEVYANYTVLTQPAGCPVAGGPCRFYTVEGVMDLDSDGTLSAWGYVHTPLGATTGVPGNICVNTGVYNAATSAPDLLNIVGPCRVSDGSTIF